MQLDPLTLITLATLTWWGRWLLKLARQPLPDETEAAIPEPPHDDAPEAQEGERA